MLFSLVVSLRPFQSTYYYLFLLIFYIYILIYYLVPSSLSLSTHLVLCTYIAHHFIVYIFRFVYSPSPHYPYHFSPHHFIISYFLQVFSFPSYFLLLIILLLSSSSPPPHTISLRPWDLLPLILSFTLYSFHAFSSTLLLYLFHFIYSPSPHSPHHLFPHRFILSHPLRVSSIPSSISSSFPLTHHIILLPRREPHCIAL